MNEETIKKLIIKILSIKKKKEDSGREGYCVDKESLISRVSAIILDMYDDDTNYVPTINKCIDELEDTGFILLLDKEFEVDNEKKPVQCYEINDED